MLTLLLIAGALAANFAWHGVLLHTWLAWPWWAQAGSAVAAAMLFLVVNGPVTGLVFYLLFTACVFFVRGPAPVYEVVPEFLPAPVQDEQDRQ